MSTDRFLGGDRVKRIFSVLLLLCVCFQGLTLSSCKGLFKSKYTSTSFEYFDTFTTVEGYAKNRDEFDRISNGIMSSLGYYHRLFNVYESYEGINNLHTVNSVDNGAHSVTKVDGAIIDMLSFSKQMHDKTDGAVNVAMGSVLSLWHEYRAAGLSDSANAKLPPEELLREAAKHTDINKMIIDEGESTVFLSDPEMLLDVGAVAKGYAVEIVAKALEENGVAGYVINVGGNVRAIGDKPDGAKWRSGIENPDTDADEPYLAVLSLAGEALVTSGSYQRFYTVEGKNYHHIIDGTTLMPSDRYSSVSVVCKSSALADSLSTALFCMDYEKGSALLDSYEGVEAMWLSADGDVKYSSGFLDYVVD